MALLTDGYQTTVTIAAFPGILFREREVTPPDLDALGEIDVTTMRNIRLRTKHPKSLVTLGPMTMQLQYDPADYAAIIAVGVIGTITTVLVVFPDVSSLTILGWIDKFKPGALKEGDFPMAEMTIIPSNQTGPGGAFVETAPVYAAPVQARPPATA